MEKENRKYKDSLFVDLFYSDETARKNLLSLYNALHGTDLEDEDLVRKIKIEDILYKNFNNDISCEVNNEVFVFGEHQSTVNPNIPIRYVMYAGRAYEQVLDKRDRYKTKLVKIPTPEFYVFYNGMQEYPLEQQLLLSDAFLTTPGSNSMDLKVTVININFRKSHEILDRCRILKDYSLFIDTVRKYPDEEEPIKKAIEECIDSGILAEYLKRKGSEVRNMLVAEYSYEEDILVKQEEARQEGLSLGLSQGLEQGEFRTLYSLVCDGVMTMDFAAARKGLDTKEFQAKLKEFGII